MRAKLQLRSSLLYFFLAVPMIFVPGIDEISTHGDRYSLGWPISGMDILIGDAFQDGRILHFQPDPLLLPIALFWTLIAGLAWRARLWAMARRGWIGAAVQALLTSLYSAAVFLFLDGVIGVLSVWRLSTMQWPALERALVFERQWLPYLYSLGIGAIFLALFLDSRARRGPPRLVYVAFALCFVFVVVRLSPYLVFQLQGLDEMIRGA